MITEFLLNQTVDIFDTPEKWQALQDLQELQPHMMCHWLKRGADEVIKQFQSEPSAHWKCCPWDNPWEVWWHLEDLDEKSIGIGFGWPEWGFHLCSRDNRSIDQEVAKALMKSSNEEFRKLRDAFEDEHPKRSSIASDTSFNPFMGESLIRDRQRELAWYAAHDPQRFAKEMLKKARLITQDNELTGLIRLLNERSRIQVTH